MPLKKTVCELFAGVGGFHVGLCKASNDWRVVFANQWESSKKKQEAFECYKTHFPTVYAENIDIKYINDNVDKFRIPDYNLLVGGFPCQDYSVARTNAEGILGKKGVLWWEIKRMLERDKPPFVLLENVDRLLKSPSKQRGRDFAIMLACFRDLGYGVEWRVINAADYGFPQKRKRVFIFAYKNSTTYYKQQVNLIHEVGAENYINNGFFSKQFLINSIVDSCKYILDDDVLTISDEKSFMFLNSGYMINNEIITQKYIAEKEPISTLESILENEVDDIYYLDENIDVWEKLKGAKSISRTSKNGHSYIYREGSMPFPDILSKPARTILTSETSVNRSTHIIRDKHTNRLRKLTPVECERLNGFPDNWTNTGMSEKFRYFCMGNALVVGLIERMGVTLKQIFEEEA